MQFSTKSSPLATLNTPCLIVGLFTDGTLTPAAQTIDTATTHTISTLYKDGDLTAKLGSTLFIPLISGIKAKRLLLVGCGDNEPLTPKQFQKIVEAAATTLTGSAAKEVTSTLNQLHVEGRDRGWQVRCECQAFGSAQYLFEELQSTKSGRPSIKRLNFHNESKVELQHIKQAIIIGSATVEGMQLTRDLSNLPGNIATPTYLAQQAKELADHYPTIKTKILDESQMQRLGMGSLLSVSRGSEEPAKLIVMEYKGPKRQQSERPVVLVGKGLTFDAGGISLKPSPAMDEMKYDMCGGASVIGTMKAVAEMALPIHLIGIVPSSENLPDGKANKPGDIVTSMSGQTIEILNTDAEGRLILCDALTYARRFEPELVIDIATLTGAVIVALGKHASGLLGNDAALIQSIKRASETSLDRAWELPLWDEYDEQLKSPFADMANIGGKEAGTITAACFLARYTKEMRWAHLDIAGTAWISGTNKGATGRPVPLLIQFLLDHIDAAIK